MTGQPDIGAAVAALDQAIRALVLAKSALLGQDGAALLISSGPDLTAAQADPGNPYGSYDEAKHGRYGAVSPAEVAEGVELRCGAGYGASAYVCTSPRGHKGEHVAFDDDYEYIRWPQGPRLCPAQWGVPPETMLCSLPSGHDGNHATAEGIEWGGQWETAEPAAKDGSA